MTKKPRAALIRYCQVHGQPLVLIVLFVFVCLARLMDGSFWNPQDFEILLEADSLARQPLVIFGHLGTYFSQPLLQMAFLGEYALFGLNFAPYIAVNLAIHALNACLVYLLVNMLFFRPRMALLAALMFAVGVGHYGKALQAVVQLEVLLLGFFHLLVLYLFIRNDYRRDGSVRSGYFLAGLAIYGLAGLTKASTLSLLGCLLAYKIFFFTHRRGRPILSTDLIVFLVLGLLFQIGQALFGFRGPTVLVTDAGPVSYTLISIKNIFRYLALMILPIQESSLLDAAGPVAQTVFGLRKFFYPVLMLTVVSCSFFGFVFGSRPLRFFIAWTYVVLIPFSGTAADGRWLNLKHLYLASLGFCVVLSAGALGTFNLLRARRWRRHLAFALPALYIAGTLSLVHRLDARNDAVARSPRILAARTALETAIGAAANRDDPAGQP
jgi:hypothetical protein